VGRLGAGSLHGRGSRSRARGPRPEGYVVQWGQEALGGTTVEVDFEKHPEGTVVRLREHGYPDTPEAGSKT
jgi:hypothetical protein